MITALVIICSIYVFAKLIGFAFKLAWGIGKVLFTFLFLPVLLIGLLLLGLKYVVLPLLIIAIIVIINGKRNKSQAVVFDGLYIRKVGA